MAWVDSLLYLVFISLIAFPIGRLIPKRWIHYDRFPFTTYDWENEGKIYNRIGIRYWMNKVPDMSRIMKKQMKRKELPRDFSDEDVRYLLDETCIAEFIHSLLCVAGLRCMHLWPGTGGLVFAVLYIMGNLLFVCIQRYNRPRLVRVYERVRETKNLYLNEKEMLLYEKKN
ncbi:MAG: glycosyl-4,4'-diaponeurosporenoate acyltransferase [Clostridia bacterium]|nr:glycosyl-4,4'-diaponeurosporenoate acyltransferase [Clostridia bacterium]